MAAPAAERHPGMRGRSLAAGLLSETGRFGVPAILVVLAIVFSFMRPESFATWENYRAILNTNSEVVILALGAMLPLIAGEFDLSVPANAGMANVVVLGLTVNQGLATWLAIVLAILASTIVGVANGIIVVFFKVSAFITTLGMASILQAIDLWYTGGGQILNGPVSLTRFSQNSVLGLPLPIVYTVVVGVVFYITLNHLPAGRKLYAVGGNRRAAELTGIGVSRYLIAAFVVSGLFAGLVGVILGARLGSATVDSTSSLLLPVFAAVFLGATTILPGRFNALGTWVSVYFLAVAISGLQHLGAPGWAEPMFNGTVLVLAVALSGWAFRRRAARARKENLQLLLFESANAQRRDRSDLPGGRA
jgi:ribose transport system permease protein